MNDLSVQTAVERLEWLCRTVPERLQELDEHAIAYKPAPGKWSKKQILGHLVDSAANNHHRFVRAQFEDRPRISYDADAWVEAGYYQSMDGRQLIAFWTAYNEQLLALLRLLPDETMARHVDTGGDKPCTVAFLIRDYVAHLEHHLRQVVPY